MEKSKLRNQGIKYLKSLSKEEKISIEEKLTYELVNSDLWKQSSSIGVTISQGFEWDTRGIIETAWKENKLVSVPKCDPVHKKLTFYHLHTYEQLEVVYYNLKEPNPDNSQAIDKNSIELLLVPGLLFNKHGYRIGFGGGYYDRFLADFPNSTASLVSDGQFEHEIPVEKYDLPVNYIVTEQGILL
ncbi:5-formyltetrahydrofolate cyclo-ligase [Virgibacillus phasianinus]|uniref:5-formyltetrahydrofolate cyclo-ligase n=1 Tax=Virgibacillus phasianinus TaxID=2017483 RepID=A0A220U528_9BACI|nr:5-formyltetrahydrofolate cyclo-ligase [Virgibacillus phasianinus]ASK63190.1 5-formyltetrahydrofolate cyclo-ligase [Virgibacillus phasianinus]